MSNTLEEVADAADAVAEDQQRIAQHAREMHEQRRRGWSWRRVLDEESAPGIVELLRRSGKRLAGATASLTRALARELGNEGESRRQIARRLGVSHQRVTAMLNHHRSTEPRGE